MREESVPSSRATTPPHRRRAYTLLELVVVLALLCLVAGLAAPSLRGFARGRESADGAAQLVALARHARTQAIAEAATYRLNVDAASGTYWLTVRRGGQFVDPGDGFGRAFSAPTGSTLAWDGPLDGPTGYAEFQPDGRTTPASVRLTSPAGETTDITCLSPAEAFEVVTTDQPRGARTRTTTTTMTRGRR